MSASVINYIKKLKMVISKLRNANGVLKKKYILERKRTILLSRHIKKLKLLLKKQVEANKQNGITPEQFPGPTMPAGYAPPVPTSQNPGVTVTEAHLNALQENLKKEIERNKNITISFQDQISNLEGEIKEKNSEIKKILKEKKFLQLELKKDIAQHKKVIIKKNNDIKNNLSEIKRLLGKIEELELYLQNKDIINEEHFDHIQMLNDDIHDIKKELILKAKQNEVLSKENEYLSYRNSTFDILRLEEEVEDLKQKSKQYIQDNDHEKIYYLLDEAKKLNKNFRFCERKTSMKLSLSENELVETVDRLKNHTYIKVEA